MAARVPTRAAIGGSRTVAGMIDGGTAPRTVSPAGGGDVLIKQGFQLISSFCCPPHKYTSKPLSPPPSPKNHTTGPFRGLLLFWTQCPSIDTAKLRAVSSVTSLTYATSSAIEFRSNAAIHLVLEWSHSYSFTKNCPFLRFQTTPAVGRPEVDRFLRLDAGDAVAVLLQERSTATISELAT